jgi:soluble lytic murein transglycosylase-like protein
MSINVDKLSLLAALTPLQIKPENSAARGKSSAFAGKLDTALTTKNSAAPAAEKARELAESLTLQMLQTSLSLSGENQAAEEQGFAKAPLPSLSALLKTYTATNPVENVPAQPLSSRGKETQLQALTVENPLPVAEMPVRHERGDTSWLEPIIAKASGKYGVDGSLIRAVIKTESDFNPRAVSHAGARGLMQLMPATARSLGVNDSFDPEQNVMAGTRFLKDMLNRYNGDVDSALAAYNWGPGNVDRRPERLPRETRDYLVRVKQLYASYSS